MAGRSNRLMKAARRGSTTCVLLVVLVALFAGAGQAQQPEWDVVGSVVSELFGSLGFIASMLNLEDLIEERHAVWRGSMAGMQFSGPAYIYLLRWPPDEGMFAGLPFDLDVLELSPWGDSTQVYIALVDPQLGRTQLRGVFEGPASERRLQLHLRTDERAGGDLVDEAILNLRTLDTSLIDEHTFRSTQGEMVVTQVEGGFHAVVQALMETTTSSWQNPPVSLAQLRAEICEVPGAEPNAAWDSSACGQFEIVEHWPENRRENVDFNDPMILVEFTDPIRLAEAGDHFEVFTMDRDGEKIDVPGRVVREDETLYRYIPDEPLEPGVIYEVRIHGGPGGIQSQFDGNLLENYWWRFSTMFEFDEEHIDVHVYQTTRDAPLLAGKPTLTRVYVKWEELDHIASDWQPTSFPARVRVYDSLEGELYPDFVEPVRIHRPDQYSSDAVRIARHTVNLHNWRPVRSSGSTLIEAEVEPYDVYPEPTAPYRYYGENRIERWPHDPPRLTFDYFLLPVGSWSEGVSSDALALAHQMARSTEIYTTQTFPVISTHGRYMGTIDVSIADRVPDNLFSIDGGAELIADATGVGRTQRYLRRIMQRIHDQHGPRTNADVIVGFFPLDFHGAGQSFTDLDVDWSRIDQVPDFYFRTVMLPVWNRGPHSSALTHELGHAFGLHHEPPSRSAAEREAAVAAYQNAR